MNNNEYVGYGLIITYITKVNNKWTGPIKRYAELYKVGENKSWGFASKPTNAHYFSTLEELKENIPDIIKALKSYTKVLGMDYIEIRASIYSIDF